MAKGEQRTQTADFEKNNLLRTFFSSSAAVRDWEWSMTMLEYSRKYGTTKSNENIRMLLAASLRLRTTPTPCPAIRARTASLSTRSSVPTIWLHFA